MATNPVKQQTISRSELAEFIRSPSTIRKFENLQSNVEEALPGNADEIRAIAQAASDLADLLQNRSYVVFNAEGELDNSRRLLNGLGIEIVDGLTPNTVTIRVKQSELDVGSMGGTLNVSHGGTGATTAAEARMALGIDSLVLTGDFRQRAAASFPAGWVRANGGTIGSTASGATRANPDTQALFTIWWTDFTDAQVPIRTSSGSASTRGGSASADFAANKRMTVPVVADAAPLIGAYKL